MHKFKEIIGKKFIRTLIIGPFGVISQIVSCLIEAQAILKYYR
jgi:hypothetical protein